MSNITNTLIDDDVHSKFNAVNVSKSSEPTNLSSNAVGTLLVSSARGTSVVDLVSRPQALNTNAIAVELKISDLFFNFLTKILLLFRALFSLTFFNSNLHKSSNKVYFIYNIAL